MFYNYSYKWVFFEVIVQRDADAVGDDERVTEVPAVQIYK